jgi:hypothetical protein
VVCNSDGHKGRVGASFPGASFFGSYGGLTCYLSPALDREAIFETMRRRHHYGTTGARIYLDVKALAASGLEVFERDPDVFADAASSQGPQAIMGDIVRVTDDEVELHVDVAGSAGIEKIDLHDGLDLIETWRPHGDAAPGRCVRLTFSGAEYRGRSRTTTWDGELSITGNRITGADMINNWNLDRGIRQQTADGLSWKAVTSGNYCCIDVWLDAASGGHLKVSTPHVTAEIDIDDIGIAETSFEAGGLERQVSLQRLPDAPLPREAQHTFRCPVRKSGDTRLYVRVQQVDGHRAWSSPVYLMR